MQKLAEVEMIRLLGIDLSFLVLCQFVVLIYFDIKFGNSDSLWNSEVLLVMASYVIKSILLVYEQEPDSHKLCFLL